MQSDGRTGTTSRARASAGIGACLALCLGLAACGGGGSSAGASGGGGASAGSAGQGGSGSAGGEGENVSVGFIVKTLSNPYFAGMEKAAKKAAAKGVDLTFTAGKYDGDVATQVSDIERMTTRGVDAIAIVPNVSSGVVPALNKARQQGIAIFAVDTNVDPASAADSFIATDNFKAGVLNGKWAKAALADKEPVIALLEGTPGSSVNTDRLGGFLKGMGGLKKEDAAVDLITHGDQGKAQKAMENALAAHPNINLVWTINEPAALGAATAIADKGLTDKILVVSMDGSCRGIKAVKSGKISTDVMQFPDKMAKKAIDEAVMAAQGQKVPKRVDTGEILVTKDAQKGVPSKSISYGLNNCWE